MLRLGLLISSLLLSFIFKSEAARLYGTITDDNGETLPFVSVYVEGTTTGTTSNQDGQYFLELKQGDYTIQYRYVGYKTVTRNISITSQDIQMDITMQLQSVLLGSVVVTGDKDPALEIIHNAQEKRKFYLEQVKKYNCNTYIKGMNYAENIPRSFMGRSIKIDGLDSSRSGIIYLSESVSKYYFEAPNKEKEVIISSKVSGKSQGFTWNSALDFNVNFYDNVLDVEFGERSFISPIASTATVHYKYKYVGNYMEDSITIHKIQVIPRMSGAPLFSGYIYIQEGTWRIHEVDFYLTKDAGIDFVDSLKVNQVYIPVTDDIWMLGTQRFDVFFSVGLVKVKGHGYYLGVFSDYDIIRPKVKAKKDEPKQELNQPLSKREKKKAEKAERNFFKGPQIKVEEESNKKSEEYWEEVRIIPLTPIEMSDYTFKDSIEQVKETKEYQDSTDQENNRYRIGNLLFGYTYRNSYKNIRWRFPALFNMLQYNTVEGVVVNLGFGFSKSDEETYKRITTDADLRINTTGKVYYQLKAWRRFNMTNRMSLSIAGGQYPYQIGDRKSITPFLNSLYTLLLEQNHMKLYERTFGTVAWSRELFNGFSFNARVEYAQRKPLQNADNLPGIYVDRKNNEFWSNNPIDKTDPSDPFLTHKAFILRFGARYRIGQKYYEYPNRKVNIRSKWPDLRANYEKGIAGILGSKTNYDLIILSIDDEMRLGLVGTMEWKVAGGKFLNAATIPFVDYKHFSTSEIHIIQPEYDHFMALPYYGYSTNGQYVEAHVEHHFNRFIFNKIPLLRKLGWQTVAGAHFLYSSTNSNYYEVTAGIEHIFKVGRVDLVYSFEANKRPKPALRLSYGF